ncbi:MAG: efflux RND transporter periplasmic adaptor subunit [Acetobacteraceae bacterium]
MFALLLAAAAPSVWVRTEVPVRGRLPVRVVAYGAAAPAPGGVVSLSVQHRGVLAGLLVVPGQRVVAGQVLARVAAAPAVVARYRRAEAALRLARGERAHMAQLRAQRLATADQLARADGAVTDAELALQALRREGGGAPVQAVRAPFAGVVTAIPVQQGVAVMAGAPLVSLSRSGALLVTVGVPPAAAAHVAAGDPVQLEPLQGGPALAGRVVGVGGMVDPRTHLVDATVAPAADPLGGAAYRAVIRTGWAAGWIVPRDAVLGQRRHHYVYQVGPKGALRVAVRVLAEDGGRTAVAGKVVPSLPLVVSGNWQLAPGVAVRTGAR